jgi:hypothetical protein
MISQIFEAHGVFVGKDADPNQLMPTGNSENLNLKKILIDMCGTGIHLAKQFKPGFRKRILDAIYAEGYDGGDWLAKHAAVYWPIWDEFEPRFVNIRRNRESTIKSNTISGMSGRRGQALYDALQMNLEQMEMVHKLYDAPYVDSDEVINGEYRTLEKAFSRYDMKFDPTIPPEVVDKRYWHY